MFTVILPVPPTANNLFPTSRSGHRFPSKKYKEWKKQAAESFKRHRAGSLNPYGRYAAKYAFAFGDCRRRDIANFEKGVTDFLVENGVLPDDCQIDALELVRLPRAKDAVVYVRIMEAEA